MGDHSKIEWTEATWNPVVGCSIVSPGCTNCYAMKDAWRKNTNPRLPRYHGLTRMTKGGPVWTGEVRTVPELLDWPLRKKKSLRIFVNSMSDLFHEDVPDGFIDEVFSMMGACDDAGRGHVFQILTKRGQRMHDYMNSPRARHAWNACRMNRSAWPARDVWLGVSVEDQARADERIPLLLRTPAAVRWISAEPLLGAVDLTAIDAREWDECYTTEDGRGRLNALTGWCYNESFIDGRWEDNLDPSDEGHHGSAPRSKSAIDWVVVGGESGPGARPFDIAWARSLRDQCRAVGVPYFLKQVGRYPLSMKDEGFPWSALEDEHGHPIGQWGLDGVLSKGGDPAEWPADLRVREYPA